MRNSIIFTSALLFTGIASAQELTLFEQIDADPENQQPAQMAMGAQPQNGQPAFTLRGTSRFGNEYTTTLLNRNGEPIKVKWHEGENVPVPGFDGFNIVAVSSKSVSVAHPAFDTCVASDESGVSCTNDNVAVLRMSAATPLASNGTPPDFDQGQTQGLGNPDGQAGAYPPVPVQVNEQGQQVFVNPFSGETEVVTSQLSPEQQQAARTERQQRRSQRLNQFEAVRIDPAEVPEGMRLVRTPFGDRIVPARE